MKVKQLFTVLGTAILCVILYIIAMFVNAHFKLDIAVLGTPQKEHLTIISLCASGSSFLIAAYTMITKGDSKLGGEVVGLKPGVASIVIYNETDKRELITDITLTRIGRDDPAPYSIELKEQITKLEKHDYIEITFPPPGHYKLDYKLVKLRAQVTLLNGNKLSFDLKDGIKAS